MKLITSGNPNYGLAKSISQLIGGHFCSRSTGYDLQDDTGMDLFVTASMNYDVAILNCYTEKMNNYSQARLLHKLYIEWEQTKKAGHIICIGSISDHVNTEQPWLKYLSYGAEKLALRQLCQTINHNRSSISPQIKCSYVSLGHMHTPLVDRYHPDEIKLSTNYVTSMLKLIIDCPECIEEITITKDRHGLE